MFSPTTTYHEMINLDLPYSPQAYLIASLTASLLGTSATSCTSAGSGISKSTSTCSASLVLWEDNRRRHDAAPIATITASRARRNEEVGAFGDTVWVCVDDPVAPALVWVVRGGRF